MAEFRQTLLRELSRFERLPSLPAVVTELLQAVDDPLASAMDVAYILREDPPLTAVLLRMANSVFYGGVVPVVSVPQAVMRLGMLEVRNVVMSLGVIRALARRGRRLDLRDFWRHCVTVALAAEAVSRVLRRGNAEDDCAFAGGLLHDLGRLVLDQFYPDAFDAVARLAENEPLPLPDAERHVLGMDHAEIAALLLSRWALPDAIVDAVAHHHDVADADFDEHPTALIVKIAEQTCVAHGLAAPDEGPASDSVPAWNHLGLGAAELDQIAAETMAGARKSVVMLALAFDEIAAAAPA